MERQGRERSGDGIWRAEERVAAELAVLYEMARDPWRASEHFLAAAEVASSRFAIARSGGLRQAWPGVPCDGWRWCRTPRRRELALQKALLIPIAVVEGYGTPAAERVSQRVIELAEQLGDHGSLFSALDGALIVHLIRGECPAAARIAERMLAIAGQSGSEVQQLNARMWAMIVAPSHG